MTGTKCKFTFMCIKRVMYTYCKCKLITLLLTLNTEYKKKNRF